MSKVRAGGHLYYFETAGTARSPGIEPPGYWLGARTPLDVGRSVEPEALDALLGGADPRSGADLGADRRRVQVAGFDLTFCAPKSVSLLHALGESEMSHAVQRGHDRAVAAAMAYVEDRALAVRREVPGLGRVPLRTQAPPAAAFVHRTSRSLDPHLHTHVVLANLGRGPDGRWSALDGRGIYAHRGAADALYHSHLRHELSATLGVAWEAPRRGRADVAGVGEQARRAFSRRSAEIAAHLAARGLAPGDGRPPSPRAAEVAALATRSPKDVGSSVEQLLPEWRRRALEVGLGPRRLEAVVGRAPVPMPERVVGSEETHPRRAAPGRGEDRALALAMAEALESLGPDRSAQFARRHVVRAWAATRERGEPARSVEAHVDRFLSSDGVVALGSVDGASRGGPGVAEGRHRLLGRDFERGRELGRDVEGDLGRDAGRRRDDVAERRLLGELLARRGMSLADGETRSMGRDLGMSLGR